MDKKEFWITNISNRSVILADLNVEIGPFKTLNLMNNHFTFKIEELQKSEAIGSIHKKNKIIKVRKSAPVKNKNNLLIKRNMYDEQNKVWTGDGPSIPNRKRSILEIKEEKYEELNVSDLDFAVTNADLEEKA